MTDDRLALLDALQEAEDGNFLRSLAETVLQILMEADVEGVVGAGRYERSGERTTWRDGYRERTLDTRLGPLNLKIPKLRTGWSVELEDPEAANRLLLPALPGCAQDRRAGAGVRHPGGLNRWCLDLQWMISSRPWG